MRRHLLYSVFLPLILLACTSNTEDKIQPTPDSDSGAVTLAPTAVPAPTTSNDMGNLEWTPEAAFFDGVEMVLVPSGCFDMGSQSGEADEQPVYRLCFGEPFYIDRYEVTNAQFERLEGVAVEASRWPDPNRPRNQVTWFEARAFCEQRGAYLPTEAEWEYAARGPDSWLYPWHGGFLAQFVVYGHNSEGQTAEAGSIPDAASWVGAYDMSGNVREWTHSIYVPYPYQPNDGREDERDTTTQRTLRGGGFLDPDAQVFAFSRVGAYPDYWGSDYGFRCARPAE